ncbi:RagB/SusD family nutrient uptake outer membrane protein [Bacteroides sp. KH569_7]|uniref:RagB/SusD family nutrient uptake outer membrane protein n=1 Tax=Bacteroides muris (ex Fokt et al. 2023) TaxID=2937417 RepID=A0A9X2NWR4_9BACE|nr:RagB/SusD family nutrient uptake outer membrane protein [Bacteroides muris (ex Fokt et al. 2023)]MCR6507741.1 RagB/SusD family nutrient uptake outer membrane protein [Bacteroides muris (ex Fokt et al. 2023)]
MKKVQIIIMTILAAVFAASCSLDEHPYSITSEQLAQSEKGAEQLVTGIYAIFWDNWCMEQTYEAWTDQDHDHCAAPGWVLSSAGSGDITGHYSYNTNNDLWSVFYRMINRANKAKESLESSTAYTEQSVVRQLYGETLFLRAFAYFHLVRMYGAVPLRLTSATELNCPRSSVEDVYGQVTEDLETALECMYYNSEGNVGAWGHADKTAAALLLARVYCTMGSAALSNKGVGMIVDIKGEQKRFNCAGVEGAANIDAEQCYSRAKELCDMVIARRGTDYDLATDYLNLWGSNNRRNKEFVWGASANGGDTDFNNSYLHYYHNPAPYGGAGAWIYMAPNLYEQYDETDDRIVHGVWHYYQTAYNGTAKWVSFPSSSDVYNADNLPENLKAFRPDFNSSYKYGVACLTKHYNGDIANPSFFSARQATAQNQDVILIRFAEAYLLRAEAEVELGNVQAAMEDVDVIRKRAKAETLYAGKVTDQVEARSMVLKERGLEFCQEFNRKFDLLRWGLYLDVMNETQSIVCGNANRSTVRSKKNLLYAIPAAEVAENKLLGGNNYGY